MSSRSIARAASRAMRASRDALARRPVSIAASSRRVDDEAESARRALCTTAAREMRARDALARATTGVGTGASVSRATARSIDVARIAVRDYSKRNKKKNKQHEPAPVVKDDDDDDDDEGGGDDGGVVEYDAKKWRRYVCVSRREEEH
jgi:uncharacterized protein YqfA (UPF0365 family)